MKYQSIKKGTIVALAGTIIVTSLCLPSPAFATGGISGSKLATPCADTVPKQKMEFEPYFSLSYNQRQFGNQWSASSLGHQHQGLEGGFRFTLGIIDNLEAGLLLPVVMERQWTEESSLSARGLGDIPIGLKWKFFANDAWALAWHAGVTTPTGYIEVTDSELPTGNGSTLYESGLVGTFKLARNLSLDTNLQLGFGWPSKSAGEKTWEVAFDLALGYSLGSFQLVVELNQSHSFWQEHLTSLFSTNVGFTWELNEQVILVTGPRFDFAGKSQPQAIGYNLAFTILL